MHDVARIVGRIFGAGAWIQPGDQVAHFTHLFIVAVQQFFEFGEIARAQNFQVMLRHFQRRGEAGRVWRQCFELQGEAFRKRTRADADRVHVLDVLERGIQLHRIDFQLEWQHPRQLAQILLQIAEVIHGVDQQHGHGFVALAEREQVELPLQVFAQGFGASRALLPIVLLVITLRVGTGGFVPQTVALVCALGRRGFGFGRGNRGFRSIGGWNFTVKIRVGIGFFAVGFDALQQRIVLQQGFEFLIQFKRRELQQTNGLLQLRREGQLLGNSEL